MPEKPATAREYSNQQLALVRATCLYVATKLGDLMDDLVSESDSQTIARLLA